MNSIIKYPFSSGFIPGQQQAGGPVSVRIPKREPGAKLSELIGIPPQLLSSHTRLTRPRLDHRSVGRTSPAASLRSEPFGFWTSRSMQRLEVSHNGTGILLVVFLREGWHLPLYFALDNKSHVRTANLELKKAGGIFAPIRIPAMAVRTALREKTSSFSYHVFSSERLISRLRFRC
jgi:hypothetical protein